MDPYFSYLQQTFNSKMESARENNNSVKVYSDNVFAVPQPSNKSESTEFKNTVLSLFDEQHDSFLSTDVNRYRCYEAMLTKLALEGRRRPQH